MALGATILLVLLVLALLPIAVRSTQEVLGRGPDPLYDLVTGEVVPPAAAVAERASAAASALAPLTASNGMAAFTTR